MPLWAQRILFGLALWLTVGKYSNYGLDEPDHKIFEHHPTVNSELLHYIKLGESKSIDREKKKNLTRQEMLTRES